MAPLLIALCIILVILFLAWACFNSQQKKREVLLKEALNIYEKTCRENCRTTQDIANKFLEVSSKQTDSLKDLHKKTLEMLSGEVIDV